jgi:hypothetical protein
MARNAFDRITAIDGAAAAPKFAPLLLRSIGGKHHAIIGNAERAEKGEPELMGGPDVKDLRNPDLMFGARLAIR